MNVGFWVATVAGFIGLYMVNLERIFVWMKHPWRFPEWWGSAIDTTIIVGYIYLIGGLLSQLI